MATLTAHRRSRDPEGRMPLREHLRELRSRMVRAAIAIAIGTVLGWFLYDPFLTAVTKPLADVRNATGQLVGINIGQVSAAFNLKLKLSVLMGIAAASPVWLYQVWAFIVPGLTRKEKRTALAFVAAAVPLFASGIGVAWLVLPNAVKFLTSFVPKGATNLIDAEEYLTFATQLFLAFGLAFVIPLFLVALNLIGVLSARALARGWRIAVFLTFLFAAIASPTPDASSMLALAFPMVGLYLLAVGIAWLNDRRKARRNPFAGLSDDEASPLDDLQATPLDQLYGHAARNGSADLPADARTEPAEPDGDPEPDRSRYDDIT